MYKSYFQRPWRPLLSIIESLILVIDLRQGHSEENNNSTWHGTFSLAKTS
jgi:hypothetical protein